jgi:hypothetical protein
MTPAQIFCQWALLYFCNHWTFFTILSLLCLFSSQWYATYFRTNLETDDVDLLYRYNELQLRKKYGRKS